MVLDWYLSMASGGATNGEGSESESSPDARRSSRDAVS